MTTLELLWFVRDLQRPPGLAATDKQVLGAIAARCNDALECWPSQATIARDCWLSERAARDSLRRLEVAGLVTVRRRTVESSAERDTNVYRIVLDEVRQQAPHVGRHVPHVRHHVPGGGAPAAGQVGRHVPHGGAPAAGEEITEENKGRRDQISLPLAPSPPPTGKRASSSATKTHPPEVKAVFEAWAKARQVHHPKGGIPKLDEKRAKVIAARLAEGFDSEMLERAAGGIWESAWHRGDNDRRREYADISLALRDAEHVEQFAALAARTSDSRETNGDPAPDWTPPPDALPPEESARKATELLELITNKAFDPNALAPKERAHART